MAADWPLRQRGLVRGAPFWCGRGEPRFDILILNRTYQRYVLIISVIGTFSIYVRTIDLLKKKSLLYILYQRAFCFFLFFLVAVSAGVALPDLG